MVLIINRLSLLIPADTSCNERGIAEYKRIHIASQPNLRDLFAMKHYGPKSVQEFNTEDI